RFLPVRMAAMRLLYVLERFPVLSETFVVDELRGLLRAGDEVTVYARSRGETGVADDLAHLVIGPGSTVPRPAGLGAALALRERGPARARAIARRSSCSTTAWFASAPLWVSSRRRRASWRSRASWPRRASTFWCEPRTGSTRRSSSRSSATAPSARAWRSS